MKSGVTSCVLLLTAVVHFTSSASFPKNWIQCKQSDPKFEDCVRKAATDAIRKMKNKGIPYLGVFSIDPLAITDIDLLRGSTGAVNLNLNFKNLLIHGIVDSTMYIYNTTLAKYEIYMRTLTPAFRLVGDYTINGKMLVLPIQGKGKADIVLENLDTHHYLKGEPVTVDGKVYMKITNYTLIMQPSRMRTQMENLFNGDKTLGPAMITFMNENWADIFTSMKSGLEETFGALFQVMANRIFLKIPLNEIFLP